MPYLTPDQQARIDALVQTFPDYPGCYIDADDPRAIVLDATISLADLERLCAALRACLQETPPPLRTSDPMGEDLA